MPVHAWRYDPARELLALSSHLSEPHSDRGGLNMRINTCVLLLTLPACAALALADEPKTPQGLLDHARYVALGYDVGTGFLSAHELALAPAHTLTDERHAIEAIRKDLEKWGKYVVTLRPDDADLLIAVRVGRRAALEIGTRTGGPGRGEPGQGRPTKGRSYSAEISSSGGDMVEVYEAVEGRPGMLLWRGTEESGLSGTPPRLYKAFREEVER